MLVRDTHIHIHIYTHGCIHTHTIFISLYLYLSLYGYISISIPSLRKPLCLFLFCLLACIFQKPLQCERHDVDKGGWLHGWILRADVKMLAVLSIPQLCICRFGYGLKCIWSKPQAPGLLWSPTYTGCTRCQQWPTKQALLALPSWFSFMQGWVERLEEQGRSKPEGLD